MDTKTLAYTNKQVNGNVPVNDFSQECRGCLYPMIPSSQFDYVITEGSFLPVSASICDSSRAASTTSFITSYSSSPPSVATAVRSSSFSGSFSYFSRYMRMVAPADPVPERRNTIRLPSSAKNRIP